jgi:hypothetical protein
MNFHLSYILYIVYYVLKYYSFKYDGTKHSFIDYISSERMCHNNMVRPICCDQLKIKIIIIIYICIFIYIVNKYYTKEEKLYEVRNK